MTLQMVEAAQSLVSCLDAHQQNSCLFEIANTRERTKWFYTPTDHGGLALADMTSSQHRLVHKLLASALSEGGYVTATTIMGLENVLDRLEGFVSGFERERGRDPLLYWISIFGTPSLEGNWSWRFGGHHISLHFALVDGVVVSTTPCFLGADPANSMLLGPHLLRPLGAAEDLAREFISTLTIDQRTIATVSAVPPTDLVGANRSRLVEGDTALPLSQVWRKEFDGALGETIAATQARANVELSLTEQHLRSLSFSHKPKGLSAHDMSESQRNDLRQLLKVYINRVNDNVADREWLKLAGDNINDLSFLWAGGIEKGEPHYYRVQGTRLFVEYDNTQRGTNHIHTVWRDLANDFGGDILAEHYTHEHE